MQIWKVVKDVFQMALSTGKKIHPIKYIARTDLLQ